MRPFRRSIFAASIAAIVSSALTTAVHAEPVSLWELNTSTMVLAVSGSSLEFRYQEPRIGLQQEGVVAGTLQFSGTMTGDNYSGTAYVFSRRCGPQPYLVTGAISEYGRAITLFGRPPSGFNAACEPTRYRDSVLVYNFLQVMGPPPSPPLVVGSINRDHAAAEEVLADLRRKRVEEEQRLAELRAFSTQRAACERYEIKACYSALRSSHATSQDVAALSGWRNVAEKYSTDRRACRSGSVPSCDAALASPAISPDDQSLLREWRLAASPFHRVLATLSTYLDVVTTAAMDSIAVVRNLPTSTHVTGGMAAILALALAALAIRNRRPAQAASPDPDTAPAPSSDADNASSPRLGRDGDGHQHRRTKPLSEFFTPASGPAPENAPPPIPTQSPPPSVVRDTPGALAALELAYAYIEEIRDANAPALDDEDTRKRHLNTLALAAKQLDAAQKLDPDAILEGQDENDIPYRYSVNELKADALLLEGITHQTYDTKRAIPALRRAITLNPNSAAAFYVLGLTHAANRNKAEAVAAFQRAVVLDPKNLSYRKELDRAQNLSGAEIAAYKATRAGERIFDAGVKTANAGIMAWNIFAVIWNIVTFPLRMVFGVFRFLGLTGFR
jgi:tetratricopeptide (TPR) repeat protein